MKTLSWKQESRFNYLSVGGRFHITATKGRGFTLIDTLYPIGDRRRFPIAGGHTVGHCKAEAEKLASR